jgi:hypothetical protein
MKAPLLSVLAWLPLAAHAATPAQVSAAFEQAKKNGASAVYTERCDSHGTASSSMDFGGGTKGLAHAAAALTAIAAIAPHTDSEGGGCPAGMARGDARVYEIYPDGTVKAR